MELIPGDRRRKVKTLDIVESVIELVLLYLQENVLPETIKIRLGIGKVSSETQAQSRGDLDLTQQDLQLAIVLFDWCLRCVGATMEFKILDCCPKYIQSSMWLESFW